MKIGDQLEAISKQPLPRAIPTGFEHIDRVTNGGMRVSTLWAIGGTTSVGKTGFLRQLAVQVSEHTPTLYVSYEMSKRETLYGFANKLPSAASTIDILQRVGLDDETRRELSKRYLDAYVPGTDATLQGLFDEIDRTGARLVIIDPAERIPGWDDISGSFSRVPSAKMIIRRLAGEAATRKICFVLAVQVARHGYPKKKTERPQLHQLQDTSAIERDCHVGLILHRPFAREGEFRDTITEVLVEKNRHGPQFARLHYRWVGQTQKLWDLTREERESVECCKAPKAYELPE